MNSAKPGPSSGRRRVEPGDPAAQFGDLTRHLRTDTGCATGDHDMLTVVANEFAE